MLYVNSGNHYMGTFFDLCSLEDCTYHSQMLIAQPKDSYELLICAPATLLVNLYAKSREVTRSHATARHLTSTTAFLFTTSRLR